MWRKAVTNPFDPIHKEDDFFLFYKPPGIHTHRSEFSRREESFHEGAEQSVGQKLYTIHRLDRGAAGLILFAASSGSAAFLGALFKEHRIQKTYHILVRGWMKDAECRKLIRHGEGQKSREAETVFRPERFYRLPLAFGHYPEVRLTWCRAEPKTGRRHQIRLHAKSLAHPVIGDIKHGDIKLSRFLEQTLGASRLWLVCTGLAFVHPVTGKNFHFHHDGDHQISAGLAAIDPYRMEPDEAEKT